MHKGEREQAQDSEGASGQAALDWGSLSGQAALDWGQAALDSLSGQAALDWGSLSGRAALGLIMRLPIASRREEKNTRKNWPK